MLESSTLKTAVGDVSSTAGAGVRRTQYSAWLPEGRSADRAFAAVFVFGSLIRLAALWAARNVPFVADGRDYVNVARLLVSGRPFVPYWPSGFPLYLAPFIAAGASDVALRASMLVFWALASWGILRLARATGMGKFAWLLLLVFAAMPSSIQMSVEPVTQQPVAALLLVALSACIRCGLGGGLAEYVLLGASLGWMALVRPSALPLVLLMPVVTVLAARRSEVWTRRLSGPLLSIALSGILIFSWMAKAHALCGVWMINDSNSANLYFGNSPWTPLYRTWYFGSNAKLGSAEIKQYPEFERVLARVGSMSQLEGSVELKRLAIASIERQPGVFLLRTVNRMRCFFGFDTFTSANVRSSGGLGRRLFPVSLALEAGLYLSIAGPAFFWLAAAPKAFWQEWQGRLLAGTIVLYAIPYWLSMSHPTYHYPIVMPLAVLGLLAWKASEGSYSRARGWVAVAVLAAIQVEWVWQSVGSLQRY